MTHKETYSLPQGVLALKTADRGLGHPVLVIELENGRAVAIGPHTFGGVEITLMEATAHGGAALVTAYVKGHPAPVIVRGEDWHAEVRA